MPPVLHISLNRFKFNVKTSSVLKNNDQFIFYPKLDLSQLCPDAVYTLHSVLGELEPTFIGIYWRLLNLLLEYFRKFAFFLFLSFYHST